MAVRDRHLARKPPLRCDECAAVGTVLVGNEVQRADLLPVDVQQPALSGDAQAGLFRIDHLLSLLSA